jgi:alkylhydroperoxidase/carboxymuconolactone decarboxylase family protein YurZ
METIEEIRQILKEIVVMTKELKTSQIETDKKFKETDRLIGGLGEKFGSFTEGLAYPSMRKILQKNYGIDNTLANYLKRFPNGTEIELDAFGFTNGSVNNAVVVEVKSHLKSEHIYKFINLLKNFKDNFPDFANKHLYGIMATVRNVPKELKEELFNNGIELAIIHDNIFDLERNPNVVDWNK